MRRVTFAGLVLIAGPAAADFCGDREAGTVFACAFEGSTRAVQVCRHEDDSFHYAYGRPGQAPELELRHAKDRVTYTPWNGIGSSIWARLSFDNQGYRYAVTAVQPKDQSSPLEGILEVYAPGGAEPGATKLCRPGTVRSDLDGLWALFD